MGGERHGGSFYDAAVTGRYLAHRHSGTASPNLVMEEPAVLGQLGDLTDLRVLDLGCGDGTFAGTVLGRGARSYRGIDGSPAMIEVARQAEPDGRARFEVGSMEDFDPVPGTADLVTSRMALHYVRDLDPLLHAVRRALTPTGRMIFTVTHPVITSPTDQPVGPRSNGTVDRYFEPGARRRSWFGTEITWYHRTVEHYVAAVLRAGFSLEALSECEPDRQRLAVVPEELARRRRVPLMLLVHAHCR